MKNWQIFIFVSELGLGDFPYFPVVPVTVKVRHLHILCLFAAILPRIPLNENHISNSSTRLMWILYACSFGRLLKKTVLTSSSYSIENPICYRKTSLVKKIILAISGADPDPWSGAFLTLDPGRFFLIPDPGSRIPDLIFLRAYVRYRPGPE